MVHLPSLSAELLCLHGRLHQLINSTQHSASAYIVVSETLGEQQCRRQNGLVQQPQCLNSGSNFSQICNQYLQLGPYFCFS